MPEFRIVHLGDGTTVAELIQKKFTGDKYNLSVELCDLRRRSFSSQSSLSSGTADSSADISVLLVTPAMITYLKDLIGDERLSLINLMRSNQTLVSLSFCVPILQVKDQISLTFHDSFSDLRWRHIEVGESRESFHQCMIELISVLEEGHWEMPVPTLKKCHLLPDKPVMVGDTVYILVEKHLTDYTEIQSLNLKFEDGSQITANQIADCLYQFEAPESSESTKIVEIFTNKGQSLGVDVIRYRNKLQLLADVLCDILKSDEFICQSLQLDEYSQEAMSVMVANWFKCEDKTSPSGDIQYLLTQWTTSLKCEQSVSPISLHQELPVLLYLCAKFNLHTFAQNILVHRSINPDKQMTSSKDGLPPDHQTYKYENDGWSSGSDATAQEEDQSSQSLPNDEEEEFNLYSDYCTPDEIVQELGSMEQNSSSTSMPESERSSYSVEKNPATKLCPPVCKPKRCPSAAHINYTNTPLSRPAEEKQLSKGTPEYTNYPVSKWVMESQNRSLGRSTSIPEAVIECSPLTTPSTSSERSASAVCSSKIHQAICAETILPNEAENKYQTSSDSQTSAQLGTPPYPKRNMKLYPLKDTEEFDRFNTFQKDSDNYKPSLPPRPNSDSSKSTTTPKSKKSRRLSSCSLPSPTSPHSHNSQDKRLFEEKMAAPVRSPRVYTSGNKNGEPIIPYTCRPSPPLPKSGDSHYKILENKSQQPVGVSDQQQSTGASTGHQEPTVTSNVQEQAVGESSDACVQSDSNFENWAEAKDYVNGKDITGKVQDISPDYSEPLSLYFEEKDSKVCQRSSSLSGESVYEEVDEIWKSFQKILPPEGRFTLKAAKTRNHSSNSLTSQASTPTSPEPLSSPSPKTEHQKKMVWSALSSKLTLKRKGKSRKD